MALSTDIESIFPALVDALPTAIIVTAADGQIAFLNRQAEQLFGYSHEELVGESIDLLIPERFRGGHPELRRGFVASPQTRPMGKGRDLFGLHRNGTEIPIEIGLTPVRTHDTLFIASAIIDIRERKRLEERFRATVESAPMAIVMVDGAGTIVLVNAETEALFGWERSELVGKKVELLVPHRHAEAHPGLRAQYLADARSRRMGVGRDLFARRKDGREFPVEIGLNPIRTEEGQFVLAAVVDLTERKQAEDSLRAANDALVASNLELQQFTYISSHDLQEPLRSVTGFAQLLKMEYEGKLDEQADIYIEHMTRTLGHMQTLINDLRSITKIESRARPLEPTQMEDVFEAAVTLLQSSIDDVGAQITRDKLPIVLGDAPQLTHLLSDLLGNALKYVGKDPPHIHVSALLDEPFWKISVADNGIGIEAQHHEMIFEVFRRAHSSSIYSGSGIGLALCRRIVRRHGGHIWVNSEPGSGSVFTFTLKAGEDGSGGTKANDQVLTHT